ncbi:TIGR03943 family protein [Paenibacillus sp. ATY16]|uniref:TIGR03943 family putative permease subunit n=1 Tax=Paenibacillus sp. ATY16 TaxID=1759312 RepID=UPI00200DB38F|nr:TIGR03943 family protein [Paenibacillus sp. ATY16]MCK9859673.1 TIGR03943 family protein [Paenibacillus sp. ATY16]
MIRLYILGGFAFMLLEMHIRGDLNKYINMRYSYLSTSAIILLTILFAFEFIRIYRKERADKAAAELGHHHHHDQHDHHHDHSHNHEHGHACACQDHDHHGHDHHHSKVGQWFSYVFLLIPILTGLFLPVQTLDSSFLKAKGFSFPNIDYSADNPGNHQFLKPDTSIFYGEDGYKKIANKELAQFTGKEQLIFNDNDYLKGLEAVYNHPQDFMGKTIGFDGFVYKGEQIDDTHYFVFRYGFIHCAADSGVFGMLVEFPKGTDLKNDDWVHVVGTLSSELYQPFKQTIPVLKASAWNPIDSPSDPYVYRNF